MKCNGTTSFMEFMLYCFVWFVGIDRWMDGWKDGRINSGADPGILFRGGVKVAGALFGEDWVDIFLPGDIICFVDL